MEDLLTINGELPVGLPRMLVDFLFDVVSGPIIDESYSYEDQVEYYRIKIFGNQISLEELLSYAEKNKKATIIMFPNTPERIRNRVLVVRMFAGYSLLQKFYMSESYVEITDEEEITNGCISDFTLNQRDEEIFRKEIGYLYSQYTMTLTEEEFSTFCGIMYTHIGAFESAFQTVANQVLPININVKKDLFTLVCEKYLIPKEERIMFHLVVDALAEIQLGMNDRIDYYDGFCRTWSQRFPQYKYGEEIEEYIRNCKGAFVFSYGNQFRNIRKDAWLFEMLALVNIKIALANNAHNSIELEQMIKRQTYDLAHNLIDVFIENKKKILSYYHLCDHPDVEFPDSYNECLVPYKKDLLYVNELIMEEINYRNRENAVSATVRISRKKLKDKDEYELLLSQKDAEILQLKKDLEYYETIEAQNFKTEVSQYNKAITDLLSKLCDYRFGSVLNELYLVFLGEKTISSEELKALLQNMVFVFNNMGVVPYDIGKIGKKVKFFDDEANTIYSVDETQIQEGLNIGTIRYPGWKYKDIDIVLPRVELIEGVEANE